MFVVGLKFLHQLRNLAQFVRHFKTNKKPFGYRYKVRSGAFRPQRLNQDSMATGSMLKPGEIQPQLFDYFLVVDFEATCDSPVQTEPQEIIEFPCLKVSATTFEVESRFHQYVRPIVNPILTQFCTDLTGIIQGMIENEPDFSKTLTLFDKWLIKEKLIDETTKMQGEFKFAFVLCGDWDFKSMLPKQANLLHIETGDYFDKWINIKKSFGQLTGTYPRSMMSMLAALDIDHTGRHHSGIDDCVNIAAIVRKIAQMGFVLKHTNPQKR